MDRGAAHPGLMDRRHFLVKGAAAGAVLMVSGLATGVGSARAAGPKKFTPGYTIGQTCVDFSGPDQYGRTAKLSDNSGSWTLIDLCPLWCNPCNASARYHREFTNYMNDNGIPFRIQPVVVEPNF